MITLLQYHWKKWIPFIALLLFTVNVDAQRRKRKKKQQEEIAQIVVDTIPAYSIAITRQIMHEKVDKEVVSLSDPNFVLKVLRGIKASRHAAKLNSLEELYQHLSPKNAKEKEIIKSVWEDFTKTNA